MTTYFIFDTETTSLKEPTIIQFAYIICDDDGHNIETYNNYWKTSVLISKASQDVHHISEDTLIDKGLEPIDELNTIHSKMEKCTRIISHNIEFDMKAIHWTRKQHSLPKIQYDNLFCTMRRSKYFVGLYNDKGWIKWPKLIELYRFLGGEVNEDKLHDAMEDVNVLKQCYFLAKQKRFW